jgi:geranylgeranylglycerol-phosphate geranylgeranyltransferase
MIFGIIRLVRPYYAVPLSGGFVVIMLYLRGGSLAGMTGSVVWAVAALACLISGGHVLNDVCDIEVDRINSPRRPLPSGQVSRRAGAWLAIALLAASVAAAVFCGPMFVLGISIVAGVLIVYDLLGKSMGIAKNVLVACAAMSLYPLAFTLAEPVHTPRLNVLFIHPVWFFLTAMGYEMLKDIRDWKGDSVLAGRPRYVGGAWFEWLAKASIIAGSAIAVVPFLAGYCGGVYFAACAMAGIMAAMAARQAPKAAIRCVYIEVVLITLGSLADLLVRM